MSQPAAEPPKDAPEAEKEEQSLKTIHRINQIKKRLRYEYLKLCRTRRLKKTKEAKVHLDFLSVNLTLE